MKKERIQLMDGLRGLAVVLMVAHHFLYDLVTFLSAPSWLFSNPVFDLLHYIFAGLFILLSGVSSRFSRSNVKRGVKVYLIAMAITLVTGVMEMPVRFGVLHFLGFSMVFYGLTARVWQSIPDPVSPVLYPLLLVGSALLVEYLPLKADFLWMLGWTYPGFYSSDYFPIFPWLFVFLLGTWLGKPIRDGRFPQRFYTAKPPLFPAIGRHALLIYVVHQPVLYGVTMAIRYFLA